MSILDHDAQLNSVFKKIEQKLENEKKEAQRAIELEKYKQRQLEEERLRKRQERIVYACVFVFLSAMTSLVYIAHKNGVIKKVSDFVTNAMNNGPKVDCEDPNNWKLPMCVELRQALLDAKWSNMYLNRQGKEKPFAIHKDKKVEENNPNKSSDTK